MGCKLFVTKPNVSGYFLLRKPTLVTLEWRGLVQGLCEQHFHERHDARRRGGNVTPLIGYNAGWPVYRKVNDLKALPSADGWIFADESMWTLNDGYLQMGLNSPDFPDAPANYHGGVNCFSFADGHVESHKWQGSLMGVPYAKGATGTHWPTGAGLPALKASDPDWLWLKAHSSVK